MRIIGVIPARFESSRFPGKPLIDLKGKSMIQRVYEGASKASGLDKVIVATDDQRIYDHVKGFGGDVAMTNASHQTGTDRCGEVALDVDADVIINIQGDEPLVDYRQLDQLCEIFNDTTVDIATLGICIPKDSEELSDPNRIKIVVDKNMDALYFSRSAIPFVRDHDVTYPFLRHIGLYAYRKSVLMDLIKMTPTDLEKVESLEQLRWLYNGYSIRVVETDIETPNIDTPEDVKRVLDRL